MKNGIYLLVVFLFLSCNQEKKTITEINKATEQKTVVDDIEQEATKDNWLYVNAENGLNLRDKNGNILYKYPNGTPINVVDYTIDTIEVIDNGKTIKGRKAIIDFYDKSGKVKGYLFEDYLCSINDLKIYDSELCKYVEFKGDSYLFSNPRCLKDVLKLEIIPTRYEAEPLDLKSFLVNKNTIKKANNIIELPTKNGLVEVESFPATSESDKREIYEYLGELPIINSYLISGLYYEGNDYILYDKDTGHITERLQSIPSFSPDKKAMIALGFNPYEPSGELEIAKIVNGKITNKRHFSFVNWAIAKDTGIEWLDEKTFVIKIVSTRAYWDQNNSKINTNGQLLKVTIL